MAGKPGRSGGARTGAGRKPLPLAVKKLKGTARKSRTQSEPSGPLLLGDPPEELLTDAADIWRYLTAATPAGVLHANNAPILERYCGLLAQYRAVSTEIARRGVGGMLIKDRFGLPARSPLFALQMELDEALRRCEAELGLTPAARSRVRVETAPAREAGDPWADF